MQINYLTSDLLTASGICHGWFMRYGGVSEGLFESLNGKKGIGDSDDNVEENRSRAMKALGAEGNDYPKLAHILHAFKSECLEATAAGEYDGFDAAYTSDASLMLSQTTADCGTVIITDKAGSIVALVHGSWHTLKEKIICDAVAKLKLHTSDDLVAGLGPMICKNCYQFGSEAVKHFEPQYLTPKKSKYLVDLKQIIIDQLYESGVSQIDESSAVCTLEDERFFSHRRNGAHSGRFLTMAQLSQDLTDVI